MDKRTKKSLILDRRIEVRPSKIHGFGVFANNFIPSGTIIEESYGLSFENFNAPLNPLSSLIKRYHFRGNNLNWILTGFGMIYNHSDNPNVLVAFLNNKFWIFVTKIDINADDELLIDYGNNYHWGPEKK